MILLLKLLLLLQLLLLAGRRLLLLKLPLEQEGLEQLLLILTRSGALSRKPLSQCWLTLAGLEEAKQALVALMVSLCRTLELRFFSVPADLLLHLVLELLEHVQLLVARFEDILRNLLPGSRHLHLVLCYLHFIIVILEVVQLRAKQEDGLLEVVKAIQYLGLLVHYHFELLLQLHDLLLVRILQLSILPKVMLRLLAGRVYFASRSHRVAKAWDIERRTSGLHLGGCLQLGHPWDSATLIPQSLKVCRIFIFLLHVLIVDICLADPGDISFIFVFTICSRILI